MLEKSRTWGPTSSIYLVFLGCSQREAKVNAQAVQSKIELFKKGNNDKGG